MSYILDALRRAEADRERERGRVPGLHTPSQPGSAVVPAAGTRRWLPWAGAGLLLLAGIVAGSWWAGGAHDTPVPAPTVPVAVVPPPTPVDRPAVAAPLAAGVPMPPATAASASPYLPPLPPPGTVAAAPAPRPAAVATPVAAPEPEASLPKLAELPEKLRRDVPKLAISGSVYSEDAASRFVIINGEVQKEGAKLGDDFVLEQIRPRELVLRFKGQRFRQPV